ncbi:hypothetical protein EHS19_05350 [Bifidobacterium jacchi]|uniref:Uncharacterized protein n=1 Tax=Bifidobacterium jacchi TaxID=2490545 RepID=A0A5N5RIY1_9BIFI|nr:hypothetical protein EHS19_05350 [Bifidobacterium jacchi]
MAGFDGDDGAVSLPHAVSAIAMSSAAASASSSRMFRVMVELWLFMMIPCCVENGVKCVALIAGILDVLMLLECTPISSAERGAFPIPLTYPMSASASSISGISGFGSIEDEQRMDVVYRVRSAFRLACPVYPLRP